MILSRRIFTPQSCSSQLKIDAKSRTVDASRASLMISSYDKHALEAAVQLKESQGGEITVLSLGSTKATKALRECLSVGADKAVLIHVDSLDPLDAFTKASFLSTAIQQLGDFDMIFCGKQATDDAEGQVGIQIANLLDIPCISLVTKIELSEHHALVTKETDNGFLVVNASLPLLITTGDTINEPRLATIKNKMAANRAKIQILNSEDLKADMKTTDIPLVTVKTTVPSEKETGIKIHAKSEAETADQLYKKMLDAKLV
ncbi:MAG: electron transfer flavoprotein subunit beta/FixA family protein [Sporolactobacillus sp.]|nr:electron transfer flavoprotein subunit beta/FixA family protein [Sporolactobacillus sp.]